MKKEKPIIVGLDIGTTKIVAIAGRKNEFGKLEILGFGKSESAGVSHGVVMNIEQCIASINRAIAKCFESNPDLEIKEVYVGIAGQHIKSLQTKGERVKSKESGDQDDIITREDISKLIQDQYQTYIPAGDQIIDIIPQDFYVDNIPFVLEPIGMSGAKVGANFHIITGDRNAVRNIKRCVDRAGIITRDLVLQPLASAAAVITDEDLEAGVAIVDIGGGTTDMAVFYDGILRHTAVIPFAGVNITEDIRKGLGVLRAQAEQMKVQFGTAIPEEARANAYITIPGLRGLPPREVSVKTLSHIIQARMDEILEQVIIHLRQVNLDKQLYGGIIITGGGSRLKHLVQLAEYVTGMGCRIGYPNEHLSGNDMEAYMNPMYSTCIGLILRGYHDYESGKMDRLGEGGNFLSLKMASGDSEESLEEEAPETLLPSERRGTLIKKLFENFKGKFISLFEDVEDQEIK